MEQEMAEITGSVENIIYTSDDGNFAVFRVLVEQRSTPVSVTLNGTPPLLGEQVLISGNWVMHAKFGEQFKAHTVQRLAPTTLAGIEKFLASGVIKGIGKAMAKRIVKKFGLDTLTVLEQEPQRLAEVSGIGKKKAANIQADYQEQYELKELMLFLQMHGVSGSYAAKIFAKYSSFSIDILRTDPYRLAREITGIGFRTADQLAESLGIERQSPERIAAGVDFALLQIAGAGHCCVPEMTLVDQTAKLIAVPREAVAREIKHLVRDTRLCTEISGGITLFYPPYLYYAEKQSAAKLLYLKDNVRDISALEAGIAVAEWEAAAGICLAAQQRQAIEASLEHGILVLTGGPGTGKTTVIKGIIAVLEEQGLQILLAAPTGRAAKRLSEATAKKAVTVHRLLESTGTGNGEALFARDADEPLEADVIIIDEVSMMDIVLLQHFLAAVPKGCRVILVGDADQLPSVGPGAVLKDILRSNVIPVVRLTEVFRQAGESKIVLNAHAINRGLVPDYESSIDFQFREIAKSSTVADAIVELCTTQLPAEGFTVRDDVQVLSPMHRLDCGVENLNKLLQEALNPASPTKQTITYNTQLFRMGDKVMQIRNNYEKNVFNGDIGFISDLQADKLTVCYPDSEVVYEKTELIELRLAYAMSVHKSQGSEYSVVIMPLIAGHYIMLQRNLLYTAVTRAKQKVILLGTSAALNTAIANDRTKRRYSLLAERLAQADV